ncbi:MAG: HAMP domain-containing sensor histidine kinase [Hyphomicrobiaceae bacterium]|nr:HAMP domain-containing sensor histidine kinase [Hyphomicrobiaceae bacterium]
MDMLRTLFAGQHFGVAHGWPHTVQHEVPSPRLSRGDSRPATESAALGAGLIALAGLNLTMLVAVAAEGGTPGVMIGLAGGVVAAFGLARLIGSATAGAVEDVDAPDRACSAAAQRIEAAASSARPALVYRDGLLASAGVDGALESVALMGRICHELRTPLNAVIGFSDLMANEAMGPLGSERYRDYARHIRASGQNLLKSAEDTLAITAALAKSRGAAPARPHDPVDVAALVGEAFDEALRSAGGADTRLTSRLAGPLDVVFERRTLRQILANLFDEALVRGGGRDVTVSAATSADTVRLTLEVATPGNAGAGEGGPGLGVAVAATLLALDGAGLDVTSETSGVWRATLRLERALQSDLFAACAAAPGRAAEAAAR